MYLLKNSLMLLLILSLAACSAPKSDDSAEQSTKPNATQTKPVEVDTAENPDAVPAIAEIPWEDFDIDPDKLVTTNSGLRYVIREKGGLVVPQQGQTVVAHYTGYLPDGTKFDSSVDRGAPFEFPLGQGRVIQAWDEAFSIFPVGTKAVIIVPPELGYGQRAQGNIPPNSTLIFEVELLSVK